MTRFCVAGVARFFGSGWHHDATANSRRSTVAWGNNWVTAGINVKLPFLERTICLLVLFRLWRPRRKEITKGKPDPLRPSKPQLAREMLCLLAARFQQRMIHMVGDAAYASGAFAGLPENVTVTSRLRCDAALNELAPPRPPVGRRKRGRPPKKGPRLPQTPSDRDRPRHPLGEDDRPSVRQDRACHGPRAPLPAVRGVRAAAVQVVLIQANTRPSGYELVRVSTDLKASAAELIERYAQRWPTEVAYEEGKHLFGVGEARNRAENAVQRTVPLPVPDDDAGDPLVRTLRPSPRRRRRAPPAPPLVPLEDQPVVRRHARQAQTRDHRLPISPRSGTRPQTSGNYASPTGMGSRRPMKWSIG